MSVSETNVKQGRINDQLEGQFESISAQVEAGIERGRSTWAEWRATVEDQSRRVAARADECVHRNTWTAVLAAVALGMGLGVRCVRQCGRRLA
jgi:ElaB/YqjD/DUF883 family membrane-anchored ribosome-binding protein